mmetsp:Transcript_16804/g.20190  ORF Transcript_16804/g.20190 Transcript_16804/m.20190 type:complete len:376 (+) Transcript_16804:45-1172(+)|eukprot:jgi/Bigna1/91960/estExt_fgenesh1_pg.C_1380003
MPSFMQTIATNRRLLAVTITLVITLICLEWTSYFSHGSHGEHYEPVTVPVPPRFCSKFPNATKDAVCGSIDFDAYTVPNSDIGKHPYCVVTMHVGLKEEYALSALILGDSIRQHSKLLPHLILLTDKESKSIIDKMKTSFDVWDEYITMPHILNNTYWLKFNAWRLLQCDRIVWIGADNLVVGSFDDQLLSPNIPAGAVDIFLQTTGELNMLNPSINGDFLVFKPSLAELSELHAVACRMVHECELYTSFPGPFDQGVLNLLWNDMVYVLPWFYSIETLAVAGNSITTLANRSVGEFYNIEDTVFRHRESWRVIHYAGAGKPWPNSGLDIDRSNNSRYLWNTWARACRQFETEHPQVRSLFSMLADENRRICEYK